MSKTVLPWSVGMIGKRFNATAHQVRYVIESRDIRPIGRIGSANVYDEVNVDLIGVELQRIDENRRGTPSIEEVSCG